MGCEFPLICYRNKFVCCNECNLDCDFGCPLDREDCENYKESEVKNDNLQFKNRERLWSNIDYINI